MLEIQDLEVRVEEISIINGFNLKMEKGKIHAIMGPNGAGKSTLAKSLAGHPDYDVVRGSVQLLGEDLLELSPDERAKKGLFMSFQYPLEIPGISNMEFLRHAYNAVWEKKLSEGEFKDFIAPILQKMQIKESFLERDLNDGFSGGEKKRNEILQMLILDPKCIILDETDSGLDIDALKIVADGVNQFRNKDKSFLIITHYQRLLEYIKPDYVHVMVEGKIVKTGKAELALELEKKGYQTCS